jgi:putative acetyltransferase
MPGADDRPAAPCGLPAGLAIRPETPRDYASVSDVVVMAFGSQQEARLVETIRDSPEYVAALSFVAEIDGQVVGHVMISHAMVRKENTEHQVAILAPLAVTPEFHSQGIGSALVRRVTADANDRGEPAVILEGSPVFYGRLGFEYSVPYGIHISLPSWAPPEAAQVLRLDNYEVSIRGQVVYPAAFDQVTG